MKNSHSALSFLVGICISLGCAFLMQKPLMAQQKGTPPKRGGLTPRIEREKQRAELEALKKSAPEQGVFWSDSPSVPIEMIKAINYSRSRGEYRSALFAPNGGWLVTQVDGGAYQAGLPQEPLKDLTDLMHGGSFFEVIRHAAFSPQGAWVFQFGMNDSGFHTGGNFPEKLRDKLWQLYKSTTPLIFRGVIKSIAFTSDGGWVLIYKPPTRPLEPERKWEAVWDNVPDDFVNKLEELRRRQAGLRVVFAPKGGWLILYNNTEFAYSNIPQGAVDKLTELKNNHRQLLDAAFAPNGGWVVVASGRFGL